MAYLTPRNCMDWSQQLHEQGLVSEHMGNTWKEAAGWNWSMLDQICRAHYSFSSLWWDVTTIIVFDRSSEGTEAAPCPSVALPWQSSGPWHLTCNLCRVTALSGIKSSQTFSRLLQECTGVSQERPVCLSVLEWPLQEGADSSTVSCSAIRSSFS